MIDHSALHCDKVGMDFDGDLTIEHRFVRSPRIQPVFYIITIEKQFKPACIQLIKNQGNFLWYFVAIREVNPSGSVSCHVLNYVGI